MQTKCEVCGKLRRKLYYIVTVLKPPKNILGICYYCRRSNARCPECNGLVIETVEENSEIVCTKCGLVFDADDIFYKERPWLKGLVTRKGKIISDHHAPPDSDGRLGTHGTPQMNLAIVKDKKGNERIAGALFLEKWRKKSKSSRT